MSFNYGGKIVTDGLVLHLNAANPKSYVSGSTTWNDLSRGGNNGALVNGPTFNSANGGSIVFDGVDDYISTSSLYANKVEFTINIWVKLNATTIGRVLCVDDGAGYFGLGFYDTTGKIYWVAYDISSKIAISTNTIETNTIYNFTGTWKGNDYVKLYINGNLDSQSSSTLASTGISNNSTLIKLFKNSTIYASGNIYNVSMYNRALSAQEILQNFNATKGRFNL